MERRTWSTWITYSVLTGLLLLFSQAAGRTTHGNSSQISVPVEETRFEQNSIQNYSLVQTISSDVRRRFVRNTAQGLTVTSDEGRGGARNLDQGTTSGLTVTSDEGRGGARNLDQGTTSGQTATIDKESVVARNAGQSTTSDCEENVYPNTKLKGGDMLDTNGDEVTMKADNYEECRDICRTTPGCNYWSFVGYWKHEFKCLLKQDFTANKPDIRTGRTSGNVCRGIPAGPSESSCDIGNCLDTENCQGDHCEDACAGISCTGGEVCLAKDHTHKCVRCKNNEDCEDYEICSSNNCYSSCPYNACKNNPNNIYCLPKNHNYECVQCTYDDHCNDDEKCSIGSCVSVCSSNTCKSIWNRKQCIPDNHRAKCVRCIQDEHCGNDEKCENDECNSVCSPKTCNHNVRNKHCKAENHNAQCVRCTEDNHCNNNYKCDGKNQCVKCYNDNHCKNHEKCNIRADYNYCSSVCTDGTCKAMVTKNQCIPNNHDFKCVECTEDIHCKLNEKCDANNECVGCTHDEDCNDDETCQNKKCNPVCKPRTCSFRPDKKQCVSKNRSPHCVKCSENEHCSQDEECQNNDCVGVCDSFTCRGQPKIRCKAKDHAAQCVSCTIDNHCGKEMKCDEDNNECIDACFNTKCGVANSECVPRNHEPKCNCKSGYKYNGIICKIITKWTEWVDVGVCSKECGGGEQPQTRKCLDTQDNPLDETECSGERSQLLSCNNQLCGVTASSSSGDPSMIVDGNDSTHFSSFKEDNPWVQLEYTEKRNVSGIRMKLHQDSDLKNIEVRIGDVPISDMMKPETVNAVCKSSKNFSTPLSQRPHVDIVCDQLFTGNVITVQKKQNETWLGIFKIEPMTTCPKSHQFVSKDRSVCCSNLTDSENECHGGGRGDQCPGQLCTHYIPVKDLHVDIGDLSGDLIKGVLSGVFILILSLLLLFFLKRKRKRTPKATKTNKKHAVTIVEIQPLTADHIIIKKPTNKKVKDKEFLKALKNTAKDSGTLKREFRDLERLVAETIEVNKATTVGKLEENKARNRYRDMVPYDHNIVYLEKPMGQPPSKYINASWIKFPDDNQRYLAVQAPKENMFSSFWQLVWEQKVGTIVMITDLVEGGKVKAHQYWPDKDNIVMDIDNGITLHYIKHEYPGTYYSRQIEVKYNNQKRMVNQIQTTAWLDLTAPKDTKILLDLVYKAQDLLDEKPGPVLVHCSAGVGRTGTFVGLYHLIKDYENDAVKEIDFYKTVLRMREQRMKMVQKHPQYHYIAKCLADYVSAQESEYG